MDETRRHPAFLLSCVLGAVGLALIVAGAVTGVDGLFLAGAASGALSLGAALYWRSDLIAAWGKQHPRGKR